MIVLFFASECRITCFLDGIVLDLEVKGAVRWGLSNDSAYNPPPSATLRLSIHIVDRDYVTRKTRHRRGGVTMPLQRGSLFSKLATVRETMAWWW